MRKLFAFTIAEVLITLGIIGVISAMTIPALISKTNDTELKVKWKKEYSAISQAFVQIVNDNGGSIAGFYTSNTGSETLKNDLKEKLAYIKDCRGTSTYGGTGNGATSEGCWHAANNWYKLNKTAINYGGLQPGLILKDGTLVYFVIEQSDCQKIDPGEIASGMEYTRCGWLRVDINGFKKPNIVGKDIFGMNISSNGFFPYGAKKDTDNPATTCIEGSTATENSGWGCAAKYLYSE